MVGCALLDGVTRPPVLQVSLVVSSGSAQTPESDRGPLFLSDRGRSLEAALEHD